LNSINLGVIKTEKQLKEVCYAAVDTLDVSIDEGTMPVIEAENSSKMLRNIGIGVLGTADWMACNKLSYEKEEDLDKLEAIYEKIAWYCYERSIQLAEEKGSYSLFEKADYSKMFGKDVKELDKLSKNGLKWSEMSKNIQENGIRNFLLLATAPNTSSGILMGATASWQPPHSKMNYQTLSNITVPILPKYIKERFWYYKGKFDYPAHEMVKVVRRMQRWIDSGISMEVDINPDLTNIKMISDAFIEGFESKELKAVYYSLTIDSKKESGCVSCAN
jgi:ribonucleoside-diphosphate reductase alpha chain